MTAPGDFSSGDVLTAADMNALPAGFIGRDTDASYTLTTSLTEFLRVNATFPAADRVVRIDYRGEIDDVAAGGRIISHSLDYSLDGGSTWTNTTMNWYVTFNTNDQFAVCYWHEFETASNTSISVRVRASKSSGATGVINQARLLVTDIGAA